jgi:DNA polymerase III subunit beta
VKFRCERDILVEALSVASRAVSTRGSTLAALAGLHFETKNDQLQLTGTDLDLTVQVTTPVSVIADGACVIPARLITDIVRALPAGAVTVEAESAAESEGISDEVRVSAGRSQFAVRTLDLTEFPRVLPVNEFSATLSGAELADALRQVVRAASADDARPVLTGVLLSAEDTGLRLVATDSYRLAIRDLPGAKVLQTGQQVLIPSKALGELTRILVNDQDVQVALEEREITFSVGNMRLTSRLIEGQFPDYRPLIPANYPNQLRLDRDVLLEAVRRVKLLVRDTVTPVRMALKFDGIELAVVSPEVGQASDEVEAKYEGEAITVAFNPAFLIDGLEAIPPGDVLIETLDALKPATLKSDGHEEYLYLIMPVRVS